MQLNNLQISTGSWHAGLTQATHLRTFFLNEPELASQVVTRIYNRQNGYKNALSFLTGGMGKSKELNDVIYRWPVMGDSRKAIPITRAVYEAATNVGISATTFKVGVGEKWFAEGDVIIPDDNRYSFRVMGPVEFDGSDYILTLQLVTNNQSDYVVNGSTLLAVGKELSKDFNAVENDHSRTSGETHYATPFMLENYLSTLRKMYSVTGAVHDKVLNIQLMSPEGDEMASTWVKYAEWEFWGQWMDELEIMLMFGKSNVKSNGTTDMKGASGNPVYMGAGLEQQIAPGNKKLYTTLTEQTIRDFMDDLSYNGTEDGEREYVALCGRQFMNLFDQAMKSSASNYTLMDTKFVGGSGQDLSFGAQFKTYVGLNGDRIVLKEYAPYNLTVRNRLLHPSTGRPAESYKATFLNFKKYHKGEPNIQKVYTKGRETVSWYIEGAYGPMGPKKDGTGSSAVDGYEFHIMSECGIKLSDPTDAAQLILDVDNL
jgi:hypothetical protein